jgi:hypothetical protein
MRRVKWVAVLAVAAAFAAAVSTASAAPRLLGLGCPSQATSRPFSQWGDANAYTLVPGGSFEGSPSWASLGTSVVNGNEPWYVNGAGDTHSLSLPAYSGATSSMMCIGLTDPTLRLFASGTGKVNVFVTVRVVLGLLPVTLPVGTIESSGGWLPTPAYLNLGCVLSLLQLDTSRPFVSFSFVATSGTVRIDDVYVDPWMSKG